jgi:hypothetical protein
MRMTMRVARHRPHGRGVVVDGCITVHTLRHLQIQTLADVQQGPMAQEVVKQVVRKALRTCGVMPGI